MRFLNTLSLILLTALPPVVAQTNEAKDVTKETSASQKKSQEYPPGKWVPLFNGKDLTGWIPKIRHRKLGDNFANTFRVEDGLLKVRYDNYTGPFNERFGHLFHTDEFSHYILRVEYRFVGKQIQGGPGWAIRNSGVMLHGEDPRLMTVDQDFPKSIEGQLLGGDGQRPRPTSNLCTPGTNVMMNGDLILRHCTNSNSMTYHGEQWVTADFEVRGSEYVRHTIGGKVVLEYQNPQLDERDDHSKMLIKKNGGLLLNKGTISLQSESHPIDFRKVEIKVLTPVKKAPTAPEK